MLLIKHSRCRNNGWIYSCYLTLDSHISSSSSSYIPFFKYFRHSSSTTIWHSSYAQHPPFFGLSEEVLLSSLASSCWVFNRDFVMLSCEVPRLCLDRTHLLTRHEWTQWHEACVFCPCATLFVIYAGGGGAGGLQTCPWFAHCLHMSIWQYLPTFSPHFIVDYETCGRIVP